MSRCRTVFAVGLALEIVAVIAVLATDLHHGIDLDVYRLGGHAWLTGQPLYGQLPPTTIGVTLPFTYPPLAAVLFSPLALIPRWLAVALVLAVSFGALAFTLHLVVRRAADWFLGWAPAAVVAVALPLLTGFEPVRETLTFGQVNLVLMALVAADCLLPSTRWPRGTLIGIAAAIKLTPAAFLLFFLVRKDFRAAVTSGVVFLLAVASGFLLAGADSLRYWRSTFLDADRAGNPTFASNQSLRGALVRLGLPGATVQLLWVVLAVAVVVVGWVAIRRLLGTGLPGAEPLAVAANATVALLVSPVSWSHHWVWATPCLVLLFGLAVRTRDRGLAIACLLASAVFAIGPQWLVPNRYYVELRWNLGQHLVGDLYVLTGLAFLVACCVLPARLLRPPGRPAGRPSPAGR
ncbi:glycosyltransferase 87 family protein [Solihabitans fulvus]|nr:glycosyltransferase 87 family protein [Solihabitans fulvus]